jgi:hypothetical protein
MLPKVASGRLPPFAAAAGRKLHANKAESCAGYVDLCLDTRWHSTAHWGCGASANMIGTISGTKTRSAPDARKKTRQPAFIDRPRPAPTNIDVDQRDAISAAQLMAS